MPGNVYMKRINASAKSPEAYRLDKKETTLNVQHTHQRNVSTPIDVTKQQNKRKNNWL
jgi:hypothetical protein